MSDALVIFVRETLTDEELTVGDLFIPFEIRRRCEGKFSEIIFSIPKGYGGLLNDIGIVRESHDIAFWKSLLHLYDHENFSLVQADAWFVDPEVLAEMMDLHRKYLAEFTFSENIPSGIGGEILSRTLIESLPDPGEGTKILTVSQAVKANINQFDVEIFYKDPDIRAKRIDFLAADPRERRIMQNIITERQSISPSSSEISYPSYAQAAETIDAHPEVLYAAPSYYEIEISSKSNHQTIYSVRPYISRAAQEMDPHLFSNLISEADSFKLPYSIAFVGGEPLLHSSFQTITRRALESSFLKTLIIETDGLLADDSFCAFLRHVNDPRIKVIVECCGYDEKSYLSIHGADCFLNVEKNIMELSGILNSDDQKGLYVQIMKINETEPFLDQYYDFWEGRKQNILLQKQNTWLDLAQDRRYYDLSPIERIPCWHLQRDLYITSDGEIPYCKQDVLCKASSSCSKSSLPEIWNSRKEEFVRNYRRTLTEKIDCASCDEWYTFNL